MKPTQAEIYRLFDPRDDSTFYVGKSGNSRRRLARHVSDAKRGRAGHKNRRIRAIIEEGLKVGLEVVERVPHTAWQRAEQRWIDYYQVQGMGNTLKGGNGSSKGGGKRKKRKEMPSHENGPIKEKPGRLGLLQRLIGAMK